MQKQVQKYDKVGGETSQKSVSTRGRQTARRQTNLGQELPAIIERDLAIPWVYFKRSVAATYIVSEYFFCKLAAASLQKILFCRIFAVVHS